VSKGQVGLSVVSPRLTPEDTVQYWNIAMACLPHFYPEPLVEDHLVLLDQNNMFSVAITLLSQSVMSKCLSVFADDDSCEQGTTLFPGPKPLDEDHPLMLAQKEDLQALGGVFLELIFSALGSEGPSESTSGPALQRLLVDVFSGNIDEFRCVARKHQSCFLMAYVI